MDRVSSTDGGGFVGDLAFGGGRDWVVCGPMAVAAASAGGRVLRARRGVSRDLRAVPWVKVRKV